MAGSIQPGANSRGRGGKFRKYTRGGGKHFSRDLRPLDDDGNEISMWSEDAQRKLNGQMNSGEDSDEENSEVDEEEGSSEESGPASQTVASASREDRKKEKKARKEAAIARAKGQAVQVGDLPSSDDDDDENDGDLPSNPNHTIASRNQTAIVQRKTTTEVVVNDSVNLSLGDSAGTPSRRERESLEAQQAKERYLKLHEQGKTDEAKADLARLKIIREKREAEAARKQAEKDAKEAADKTRKEELEAREAKKRETAQGKPGKAKGKK